MLGTARFVAAAAFVFAAGMLVGPTVALAQTAKETAKEWNCTGNPDIAWDVQISGCTAVIQSGNYSGMNLAWAFNNRGNAYTEKKEYDRAIADYDQAIRLNPKYALVFDGRGINYKNKGQLDRAIA